jgi:hypothetical protein
VEHLAHDVELAQPVGRAAWQQGRWSAARLL